MRNSIASLGALLFVSACVRTDYGYVSYRCARPAAETVDTPEQAVVAARRTWYCINPSAQETDEQYWLENYRATSERGVWRVSVQLPEGYAGGGLNMELAQNDGKLLNLYITQ